MEVYRCSVIPSFGQHIRWAENILIENWWKNMRHIKKQGPPNDDPVTPSTTWLISRRNYRDFFRFHNILHIFFKIYFWIVRQSSQLIDRHHTQIIRILRPHLPYECQVTRGSLRRKNSSLWQPFVYLYTTLSLAVFRCRIVISWYRWSSGRPHRSSVSAC